MRKSITNGRILFSTDPCRIFHTPQPVQITLDFKPTDDTRLAMVTGHLYVLQRSPTGVLRSYKPHCGGNRCIHFTASRRWKLLPGKEYSSLECIGCRHLYCIEEWPTEYRLSAWNPESKVNPESNLDIESYHLCDKSSLDPKPCWHGANRYLERMQVKNPPFAIAGDLSLYEESKDGDVFNLSAVSDVSCGDGAEDNYDVKTFNQYMTMVSKKHAVVKTANGWILYASIGELFIAIADVNILWEALGKIDVQEDAEFRMWWDEERGFLYFWSDGSLSAYSVMYTDRELAWPEVNQRKCSRLLL